MKIEIESTQRIVCLCRHGESVGNLDVDVYRHTRNSDIPLTDKGKEQIQDILWSLTRILPKISTSPIALFSSPFLRAKETAEIFADTFKNEIQQNILLAEQDYGLAEGCDGMKDFVKKTHGEQILYERYGRVEYRPPRGESLRDVYIRAGLFVQGQQWFRNHLLNFIIAHQGVCAMMESYLMGSYPQDGHWDNAECRIYKVYPAEQKTHAYGSITEKSLDSPLHC